MARGEERRAYDGEIAGMRKSIEKVADASMKTALHIERIATLQEVYVKQIKDCSDETGDNAKDIIALQTKQKVTQYIGSTMFLGFILYISKNAYHWFKS